MNFNPLRLFGARPQKRALDESSELYRALAIYNQTASGFSVNDETALTSVAVLGCLAGPRRFLFFAAAPGPPEGRPRSRGARRPSGLPAALRGAQPHPHRAAVLALEADPGRPRRQRLRTRGLGQGRAGRGLADDRRAAHHEDDAGGHGLRLLGRRHRPGRRLPGERDPALQGADPQEPLLGPLDHQRRPRHHRPVDRLEPVLRALPGQRQPLPGLPLDRPGLDRRGLRGAHRAVQGLRRRAQRRRAAHLRPRPQAAAERHEPQRRAAARGAAVDPRGVLSAVPRAAAAAAGLDARHLHQRRAGRHLVRPAHAAAAGRRHRGVDRAAPVPAERDRRRLLHQVQHRLAAARRLRGALGGLLHPHLMRRALPQRGARP